MNEVFLLHCEEQNIWEICIGNPLKINDGDFESIAKIYADSEEKAQEQFKRMKDNFLPKDLNLQLGDLVEADYGTHKNKYLVMAEPFIKVLDIDAQWGTPHSLYTETEIYKKLKVLKRKSELAK